MHTPNTIHKLSHIPFSMKKRDVTSQCKHPMFMKQVYTYLSMLYTQKLFIFFQIQIPYIRFNEKEKMSCNPQVGGTYYEHARDIQVLLRQPLRFQETFTKTPLLCRSSVDRVEHTRMSCSRNLKVGA